MSELLIGGNAQETLSVLNDSLRQKTVALASRLEQREFMEYVPWLCLRPALSRNFDDPDLMDIPLKKGALLDDRVTLERLSEFLNSQASLIVDTIPADSGKRERFQVYSDIGASFPEGKTLFRKGRDLLFESSDFLKEIFEILIDTVVPLKRDVHTGVSSHVARGAVFLAFFKGYEVFDLALELAHETGHQALMLLQSADELITSPHDQEIYSGVRGTLRPAIQCLHASAALAYMVRFSNDLLSTNHTRGHSEYFERARAQARADSVALGATLSELDRNCTFTRLGNQLIIELTRTLVR